MNLTIENLTKSFGEKQALNIDYYSIHSGEIIGLVGNNGAGKTTLFRIILDLVKSDTGCGRRSCFMRRLQERGMEVLYRCFCRYGFPD